MMSIAGVNALDDMAFVARFGSVYEHSPWVAASVVRPFADVAAMKAAFAAEVQEAGAEAQLALVRAHPELGHRAGIDPDLTRASQREQGGAGLDRLTPDEYAQFRALNDAYAARFAMPFVICVRAVGGVPKEVIMDAMTRRLANTAEAELATALAQIDLIAALRIDDLVRS